MKLFKCLSILFVLYELLKIIFVKSYWSLVIKDIKIFGYVLFELFYLWFLIMLLFNSQYWLAGLIILVTSIITIIILKRSIICKSEITSKIKTYLVIDSLISILILLIVIFNL